jgi:hypothetical protein
MDQLPVPIVQHKVDRSHSNGEDTLEFALQREKSGVRMQGRRNKLKGKGQCLITKEMDFGRHRKLGAHQCQVSSGVQGIFSLGTRNLRCFCIHDIRGEGASLTWDTSSRGRTYNSRGREGPLSVQLRGRE